MTAIATPEVSTEPRLPAVKAIRRSFSSPIASLAVIVITVLWTIPTLGLFVTSIRPAKDVATSGWWTFFEHPAFTADNYNTVLFQSTFGASAGLMPYLINSLAITIPATVIPLTLAAMAAYALAWVRFRFSDTVFFIIFALQIVPLQMALIPLLQGFNWFSDHTGIDLNGTYVKVWTAHTMFALPLAIFLLHNFIAQLPRDVMEAATVDGAGHFKVFRTIVVPLSTPALASFAIFQFLWVWNDLLVALIYLGGQPAVSPVTVTISNLVNSLGQGWQLLTAAAFVSMALPLALFFSLQRYFASGLLAGAVKG